MIRLESGALFWEGDLSLDADGSPRAYHPADWGPLRGRQPLGLDAPENAGRPLDKSAPGAGTWWGVYARGPKGRQVPVVQSGEGPDQPYAGFFVSTTALNNPDYPPGDVRRYVDSEIIPYIAIPPELQALGLQLGDLALVSSTRTGLTSAAIVADVGPRRKLGEGSIALAKALGLSSDPRGGGRSVDRKDGVRVLAYPRSGDGYALPLEDIERRARALSPVA